MDLDLDKDGIISVSEAELAQRLVDLENKDKKEDQLRKMAWVAMISMLVLTTSLFLPIVSIEKIAALSELITMFYVVQAGIVATFFGVQAYINR